jgi:hypothetical protein
MLVSLHVTARREPVSIHAHILCVHTGKGLGKLKRGPIVVITGIDAPEVDVTYKGIKLSGYRVTTDQFPVNYNGSVFLALAWCLVALILYFVILVLAISSW